MSEGQRAANSPVKLRPATVADIPALLALAEQIWEGHDYLPARLGGWLDDRVGTFTVAESDQGLVGCAKLSCLRTGEWWLEGLRVHPSARGHGVARLLHDHAVSMAELIGTGVLRFSTASTTVETQRLAATSGFRRVLRALPSYSPERREVKPVRLAEETEAFAPAARHELERVRARLQADVAVAASAGLAFDGWKAHELLPAAEWMLEAGEIFWWRGQRGLVGLRPGTDKLQVSFIAVDPGACHLLLADVAAEADHGREHLAGNGRARIVLPAQEPWLGALAAADWAYDPAFELHVYARPLGRPSAIEFPRRIREERHDERQ
jgi:N-acetylglutamate synthase-like GNAT family acetyltransferase